MRSEAPHSARALWVAALLGLGAGCSSPQSFIVLALESSGAPITGVAEVTVAVSKASGEMKTLTYPASSLTIPADADVNLGTLSVGFSGGETGDITFEVAVLDALGCTLDAGGAIVTIKKGAVNEGLVLLAPSPAPCGDGGAVDLGTSDGSLFPGCDPVTANCATGETCQIDCTNMKNECIPGGAVGAGGACQSNADCAPGSQCFDYSKVGCSIKICLRFCGGDGDCAAGGAAGDAGDAATGSGPGSFCRDPVICGSTTAYHTCTASCDPTAAAAVTSGGCAAGLACLMTGSDRVDCGCPESTRTGHEGDPCTGGTSCAPGFICNSVGGVSTCRAVCRCDENGGRCGATNDCPTTGTACSPVSGQTIYGVCL